MSVDVPAATPAHMLFSSCRRTLLCAARRAAVTDATLANSFTTSTYWR
jgi:hypothetical protein